MQLICIFYVIYTVGCVSEKNESKCELENMFYCKPQAVVFVITLLLTDLHSHSYDSLKVIIIILSYNVKYFGL